MKKTAPLAKGFLMNHSEMRTRMNGWPSTFFLYLCGGKVGKGESKEYPMVYWSMQCFTASHPAQVEAVHWDNHSKEQEASHSNS